MAKAISASVSAHPQRPDPQGRRLEPLVGGIATPAVQNWAFVAFAGACRSAQKACFGIAPEVNFLPVRKIATACISASFSARPCAAIGPSINAFNTSSGSKDFKAPAWAPAHLPRYAHGALLIIDRLAVTCGKSIMRKARRKQSQANKHCLQ